jgi:SAM-dependent methyltransferase
MELEKKERIEIDFWKNAPEENPEVFSVPNIVNKFGEAAIFQEKLSLYTNVFKQAESILEVGAGQGWASAMLKHYHPKSSVTATDISPYAIQSIKQWETIFRVKVDETASCKSYNTPFEEASFDVIFCFASAHHFVKHHKSLVELKRLLKPGGSLLYLHEPACRRWLYGPAKRRVNRKRPVVPEDLLLYPELRRLAKKENMEVEVHFTPTTKNRSVGGTFYYALLSKLPFLQGILPCTVDVVFKKKTNG